MPRITLLVASLAAIDGRPAVAYYNATDENVRYIEAEDPNGESWGEPETVDSPGRVGRFVSLVNINDEPGLAYYDETNRDLKFATLRGLASVHHWNLYSERAK